MRLTDQQMEELVQHLRGSCDSIENGLNACFDIEGFSELENEMEVMGYLDSYLFCCDVCSWWCENSERSYEVDDACTECEPGNDDD